MTDYKLIGWIERNFEQYRDDVPAYIEACNKPDLNEFLNHYEQQCDLAEKNGHDSPKWNELRGCTEAARDALATNDQTAIAMAFHRLGAAEGDLGPLGYDNTVELLIESLILKEAENKRQKPNREKAAFIDVAQDLAKSLWAVDTNKQIRLSEMCELVFSKMYNLERKIGKNLLPDKPESIKSWLREVAPDHAKKGGRPRSGKNKP